MSFVVLLGHVWENGMEWVCIEFYSKSVFGLIVLDPVYNTKHIPFPRFSTLPSFRFDTSRSHSRSTFIIPHYISKPVRFPALLITFHPPKQSLKWNCFPRLVELKWFSSLQCKNLLKSRHLDCILQELSEKPTMVVSGHHGKLHIDGLRLIIDEGGGLQDRPVAAVVLPPMKIVRDTDNMKQ